MLRAVSDPSLDEVLSSVSRSFYLSLAVLPREVRDQLSSAYLVARAADTIADTHLIRAERRLELLRDVREALLDEKKCAQLVAAVERELLGGVPGAALATTSGGSGAGAEQRLLARFGECLQALSRQSGADRERTRRVLTSLVSGMEKDLERFPGDGVLRSLATMEDLDEHTYLAAGCVGEYWTEMCAAHIPATAHMSRPDFVERGVRLGKALQLVNVIRDAPADLADGRCYFPQALLAEHHLRPEDLVGAERHRARAVVDELRQMALAHVDAAWPYVMAVPRRAPRLRLACVWPLWIGLATLERIAHLPDPLAPGEKVKIGRREVYGIVATSLAVVAIDPLLKRRHWTRRAKAGWRGLRTSHGL